MSRHHWVTGFLCFTLPVIAGLLSQATWAGCDQGIRAEKCGPAGLEEMCSLEEDEEGCNGSGGGMRNTVNKCYSSNGGTCGSDPNRLALCYSAHACYWNDFTEECELSGAVSNHFDPAALYEPCLIADSRDADDSWAIASIE